MGIPLGDKRSSYPGVKFRQPGQYIDLALISTSKAPLRDYATGAQKMTDDGKPREQDVVTALVVRGTALISENDVDRVPEPGTVVSLYCAGHHRWDYIQAQKALDGGIMVGDLMRVVFKGEEPGKGVQPKKVWTFMLRHPNGDEAAQTAQCESLHRQLTGTSLAGASSAQSSGGFDPQSEPF